ncbi:MAG TPA: FAD-dependent monooxygenase [Gammaproteobacteria bacterium]|jgi:2-octaprenyl-6-methoxyphenol hydroxylase|nr:FAD-dependent monooxygenase [Gammaproteobacteria bacterium]
MRYDIIIVGGGLVGAGFAAALKDSGLRIALIDARLPSNDDPRLFALNAGSCQFLDNLGFWSSLQPHSSPIHQVHVSHQGNFGAVRMRREEVNLSALGHVVPAKYIEAALSDAVSSMAHIEVYRPARLKALTQTDCEAEVTIETKHGDKTLQSEVVIGADGTVSTVRKLVDIPIETVDYQQCAIVTRVMLRRPHNQIAYERFYKNGAIAMLPLPENECASIWSASKDEAERLYALSDDNYLSELQKLFGFRLGKLQGVRQRHLFPLQMMRAARTHEKCVLLLGNSAHTLHPIAAQGFNLALYEAAVLVEGIMEKRNRSESVSAADLQAILGLSRKQLNVSVNVSHWLSQIFSLDAAPAHWLLSLGMTGFNAAAPVKKTFINMMTGRSGRVPSLLLRQN